MRTHARTESARDTHREPPLTHLSVSRKHTYAHTSARTHAHATTHARARARTHMHVLARALSFSLCVPSKDPKSKSAAAAFFFLRADADELDGGE